MSQQNSIYHRYLNRTTKKEVYALSTSSSNRNKFLDRLDNLEYIRVKPKSGVSGHVEYKVLSEVKQSKQETTTNNKN